MVDNTNDVGKTGFAEQDIVIRSIGVKRYYGEEPNLTKALDGITLDIYRGEYVEQAPDIVLGYNRGYRVSWSTPLGRVPKNILEDNTERWSGDHCGASEITPGIIYTNKKIRAESPAPYDLTATILDIYGIPIPPEMIGKSVF